MNNKKVKIVIIAIVAIPILVLVFFLIVRKLSPMGAKILIQSDSEASVYINSQPLGVTPIEKTLESGDVVVKLEVPNSSWEKKIKLTEGVLTVIRRNFSRDKSFGHVISFEKDIRNQAISIISNPDGALVTLDGQVRGVTPIKLSNVPLGNHEIRVSASGYKDESFSVNIEHGFRLISIVDLAFESEVNRIPSLPPSPTPLSETKQVEILSTPTGFLRVREEPNISSPQIGEVAPGEIYKLEESSSGWYKILLNDGKSGWISGEYATSSASVSEEEE